MQCEIKKKEEGYGRRIGFQLLGVWATLLFNPQGSSFLFRVVYTRARRTDSFTNYYPLLPTS